MRWLVESLKKNTHNLSEVKSLCAFIFKAKPLGAYSLYAGIIVVKYVYGLILWYNE